MKAERRSAFSVLGVGAAACLACCAGPVLAFLGGLGLAGLLSTMLIGAAGLAIAAAALVALFVVCRRRTACVTPPEAAVPVATPTRREAP